MKYRLGDLIQSISNTYNFENKSSVMFINTSDIYDGMISGKKTDVNKLPGQAKKSILNGDILFSEIRPKNKRFALVKNLNSQEYVVSTKLMVLRNKSSQILNTKYLYFYLTSPKMLKYFQSEAESRSGTFPQITFRDNVAKVEIELPTLDKQDLFVKRIDSINKKIRINNQINDNLLELNNTIFKNNFSQCQNYLKASDIAEIRIGKTPPRKESQWFSNKHGMTWLSIKDMKSIGIFAEDSSEKIVDPAIIKFNIQKVPKDTVIVSFKLTVGRVKIANHEMLTNEAIAQFKNAKLPYQFLYTYLSSFPYETLGSTSSIARAINSKILRSMPILIPSKDKLIEYMTFAKPVFEEIRSRQLENKKLIELKTSLLEKDF